MVKKTLLALTMSLVVVIISTVGLEASKSNNDFKINTQNIAGSYTEIVEGNSGINWSTGMIGCDTKYKDVYTTTSSTIRNDYNGKYQFVDSWKGPTPKTRTEKITSGTERSTSFSGEKAGKIFKLAAAHNVTNSSATSVETSFTFPGDNTQWNLYISRRNINKLGYTSRTSYISELCYTYIWGIAAWDFEWTTFTRYPSRDFSTTQACDTVENQYGHNMIR